MEVGVLQGIVGGGIGRGGASGSGGGDGNGGESGGVGDGGDGGEGGHTWNVLPESCSHLTSVNISRRLIFLGNLGVMFDQDLTFNSHVQNVARTAFSI